MHLSNVVKCDYHMKLVFGNLIFFNKLFLDNSLNSEQKIVTERCPIHEASVSEYAQ